MITTRKLQILILEDRPTDAELVMRELRKEGIQFEGKRVATEADFLAELRDYPPDLILADYSLPNHDGLSALAAVRKGWGSSGGPDSGGLFPSDLRRSLGAGRRPKEAGKSHSSSSPAHWERRPRSR